MARKRKQRIIIGSSSETRDLAAAIKRQIEESCDCSVWYDEFFKLGNYVFNDLIQKAISYDFAILIGGVDDRVIRLSTNDEKLSPRDNIYLEYGMFSGILSTNRILFLLHKDCRVASDLAGMTLEQYDSDEDALQRGERWLKKMLSGDRTARFSALDIELLPTVGVAVGYFHNFVEPFAELLASTKRYTQDGTEYPVNTRKLIIHVPAYLTGKISDYTADLKDSIELEDAQLKYRFLLEREALTRGELIAHDVPSTLLAVFKTIDFIFNTQDIESEDARFAKYRALDNFYDNLARMLERYARVARFVELRRMGEP